MNLRTIGMQRQSALAGGYLLAATALLAGCGGVPLSSDSPAAAQPVPAVIVRNDVPVLPPAGSGRGGYYMDDGPGDTPPERLMELPDGEPRIEPYGTRGNRPYVVFGKRYTPFTDDRPYKARGRGSWYGKKFHGQKTSSGEIYDMYKMTAAHPTLPLPSYARVTNTENGRQVIVRVNDRGPFLAERIIDLSYTAALKLGYLAKGSALLEVERLLPDEIQRMTAQRNAEPTAVSGDGSAVAAEVASQELPARVELASAPMAATPAASLAPVSHPAVTSTSTAPALPAPGVYLQLGAFGQAANADTARARFVQQLGVALPPIEVVEQGALYRIYSGPFASRAEAELAAQQLERSGALSPLIVQR
jgi:rare lipoprotein A